MYLRASVVQRNGFLFLVWAHSRAPLRESPFSKGGGESVSIRVNLWLSIGFLFLSFSVFSVISVVYRGTCRPLGEIEIAASLGPETLRSSQ